MAVTITVDDLRAAGLDEHFNALDAAITQYQNGGSPNVAVVSEPFGGREALLEYVTDSVEGVDHVTFPSTATAANLPDLAEHDALVLSDCHSLFTRRIGGFDVLDEFLESVAASDTFVVTAWNEYAWSYLRAVRDVHESFGTVVPDPDLSAEQVAALLTDRYEATLPEFVETDAGGRVKSISFESYPLRIVGNWTVPIPRPELNLEYITSWSPGNDETEDTRAVVFQKIALLSNGNPGIATVLFENSMTDGQIAPAYVEDLDRNPDLDDEEAFVLWTILANDDRSRDDLDSLLEDIPVDRRLQTLEQQNLVNISGESVGIVPEALHAAVVELRGRRLIW